MPFFTYTNTISNGIAADGNNLQTNFSDVRNAIIDGTKDIKVANVTIDSTSVSTVPYLDSTKKLVSSSVTPEELGLLSSIKLPRPAYCSKLTDTSQVIVPASTQRPAIVKIGNAIYTNTSTATMDLDTAGRNGLDTGAKAGDTVYYLYAIPPTSGTTFDLVCSVTNPQTGPTGFASFSYLGAFVTQSGSTIADFNCANGIMLSSGTVGVTVTSASVNSFALKIPYGAYAVYLRSSFTTINAVGDQILLGSSAADVSVRHSATSATVGNNSVMFSWVTVSQAVTETIYAGLTSNGDDADLVVFGWMERPEDFV